MTREDWIKPASDWDAQTRVERADTCILFLAVHGLITEGEKRKIRERFRKQIEEAQS